VESPDLTKPQGERDRAMLEMLYATGMRVSELVSMDISNINFESNEVRVWGKGNKERIVLLGGKASQAITDYINHGRKELLGSKKSSALFYQPLRRPAAAAAGSEAFKKVFHRYRQAGASP